MVWLEKRAFFAAILTSVQTRCASSQKIPPVLNFFLHVKCMYFDQGKRSCPGTSSKSLYISHPKVNHGLLSCNHFAVAMEWCMISRDGFFVGAISVDRGRKNVCATTTLERE